MYARVTCRRARVVLGRTDVVMADEPEGGFVAVPQDVTQKFVVSCVA